ncbi:BAD_collapsed_G0000060.mRNA.1.CDS.1 [Saccharomyces cerevisiae]|nr:BAD_collapsed_G0000060.mRNA.1.CDS.1 [Saccharomyces cerevisiae]
MVTTKPLLDNVQQVGLLIYDFSFVLFFEPIFLPVIHVLYQCNRLSISVQNNSSSTILFEKDETAKFKSFQDFAPCIKEAFEVSLKKMYDAGEVWKPVDMGDSKFFKEALQ